MARAEQLLTSAGNADSEGKLQQLLMRLRPLAADLAHSRVALEEDRFQDCIEGCGRLLAATPTVGADPLRCVALRLRCDAALARGDISAAIGDSSAAVALQPDCTPLLMQHAEALHRGGRWQEALLALQAVMAINPGTPGLLCRLEAAASPALRDQQRGYSTGSQGSVPCGSHHEVLGVTPSADAAAVRRAYRRAAAICHPDRCAGVATTEADKEAAAASFLRVQQAYDVLGHEGRRAHYEARLAL